MNPQKISRENALRFGVTILKENYFFLLGFTLLILVINLYTPILDAYAKEHDIEELPAYLLYLKYFFFFWQIVFAMGLVKICLKFKDNQEVTTADIFSCFHLFLKYFVASFIYGTCVLLGVFLLIVPGIIIAIKFQFYEYYMIDKNLGIKESFERSDKLTRGVMAELLFLGIILLGLNLLGAMFFGIGLLVTFPISKLAMTHVYRQLEALHSTPAAPVVE